MPFKKEINIVADEKETVAVSLGPVGAATEKEGP